MTKKLKYIVSISLVFVLLAPLTTQLFDSLFHHHYHNSHSLNADSHFQIYHDKCPIPDFQLSLFSLPKSIDENEKTNHNNTLIVLFRSAYYSDLSNYSFLLRAPPIQTRLI